MDNGCRGCVIYAGETYKPKPTSKTCPIGIIKAISETEECPCRKCLVKVMCTGVCVEFKKYVNTSRRITEMGKSNGE